MSNWFDGIAKRAARRAPTASTSVDSSAVDDAGLSRRQVLARGAVITGLAWTAPALLAARPAFAGASICTDPKFPAYDVCGDAAGTEVCCPPGEECLFFPKTGKYACDVPLGSPCTNNGNGQCNGGISRCNHTAGTERERICGGPGTECIDGSSCVFGNCGDQVGQSKRCGGLNAVCKTDAECAPSDPNNPIAFTCIGEDPTTVPPTTGLCKPVS